MTATAQFDLDSGVADVPPAAAPRPPRWRLVVFILAALLIVVAAGAATIAVDRAARISVPDVTGSPFAEAVAALERDGLAVDGRGSTRDDYCVSAAHERWCAVVAQRPAAGERLHAQSSVALVVAPIAVPVPDASGWTFAEATAMLAGAGLAASLADPAVAGIDGHRDWAVSAQSPALGADVPAGTKVALTLTRPTVVVTPVTGLPLAQAAASLESAGLVVAYALPEGMEDLERELMPPAWVVTGSSPVLGGDVPVGTTVELEWGAHVPDLVGMPGEAAEDALVQLGLEAEFADGSPSDTRVVAQQWAEGTTLKPGEAVMLTTTPTTVVFEVVTDEGGASIVVTSPIAFKETTATAAKTPWRMTFSVGATPDVYTRGTIAAKAMGAATSVTCSIIVNGVKVATDTATGAGAVVACQ